jgi:hypothetical protein
MTQFAFRLVEMELPHAKRVILASDYLVKALRLAELRAASLRTRDKLLSSFCLVCSYSEFKIACLAVQERDAIALFK